MNEIKPIRREYTESIRPTHVPLPDLPKPGRVAGALRVIYLLLLHSKLRGVSETSERLQVTELRCVTVTLER